MPAFLLMNKKKKNNEYEYYDKYYYRGQGSNYIFWYSNLRFRFLWQRRLKILNEIVAPGRLRLLDIGCAFGFFLKLLEDRFEAYGIDISEYAIKKAKALLSESSRVKVSDITEGVPFDEKFDIITAFDIMEHVTEPALVLTFLKKALKPAGILYLEMPTHKTFINRDGSHHYRPVREWVGILEQAGFKQLSIRTYYTIGLRTIMIPSKKKINYCSIISKI